MKKALVYSKYNDARISSKKVAPVMDLIRGKDATEAKLILAFDRTKAGAMLLKTLKSAIANAKHNLNVEVEKLFVSELYVGMGKPRKTGRIVARGRFSPILKRTSHITLGLSKKEAK